MSVHVRSVLALAVAALSLAAAGCGRRSGGPAAPAPGTGLPAALHFAVVASGLSDPLFVTAPPGDARLFVVERPGRVRIVAPGDGLRARPFLDVGDRVRSDYAEQGLLGLAFAPDYAHSGRFYVDYTDGNGNTRVVRYLVSSDPDSADAGSAEVILAVDQPYANHNGGMLAFGPDGMLYVGLGDGGGAGDPQGNGQNPGVLLGKLLRLDVSGAGGYAIPRDNPFGGAARPEIWSLGLRNPWRFSFDRATGDLYVADVGQGAREEVDVAPARAGGGRGLNFGWNRMEGFACYPPAGDCDSTGLTPPVLDYDHAQGCSIIGGYVYRGAAIPGLHGHYLYADWCGRWLRSFRWDDGQVARPTSWGLLPASPLSFGEDAAGELYVGLQSGEVVRIVP
jgi:glucose/arabinose dehydrogenase